MPVSATAFKRFAIEVSTNVTITNLSATLANTEYSHALTSGLKQLIIRSRGRAKLQVAFVSGQSGTNFITIPGGANLSLEGLEFTGKTVYVQANQASTIVEILELY